jgi:hypothetical protein
MECHEPNTMTLPIVLVLESLLVCMSRIRLL